MFVKTGDWLSLVSRVREHIFEPNPETANALRESVRTIAETDQGIDKEAVPVPMILFCPMCSGRHIDRGTFSRKPHHTHACQHCGFVWRPAVVSTFGVDFLPGFKDEEPKS